MARIQMGSIVTDISGKLGGHVYGSSRYGKTLSNKSSGKRKSLTFNTNGNNVALNIATVSQSWLALTDSQRLAWQSYAVSYCTKTTNFGTHTLAAYTAYSRVNHNLLLCGEALIQDPVAPEIVTPLDAFGIASLTPSNFSISWSGGLSPNETFLVRASAGRSAGLGLQPRSLKLIKTFTSLDIPPYDILASYIKLKGAPVVDTVITVEVFIIDHVTGQRGKSRVLSSAVSP